MEKINQEKWKAVKNFEGIYEISNKGRVRRISYENKQYKHKTKLPYYIKFRYDKDGYVRYTLCNGNKIKQAFAHRLVAEAFIPNPYNFPVINHKDCNNKNNNVDNLEWCTIKYNNQYIKKMGRTNYCYGSKHPNSKKVIQLDNDGKIINEFESSGDASRKLGISSAQIRACCNYKNKLKTVHGFIFKYKEN